MRILLLLLVAALLTSCTTDVKYFNNNKKDIIARITYYDRFEDKYGNHIACCPKQRAVEGKTVAAHHDFPFFAKINIPELKGIVGNGDFIVQDRGRAIESKKASRGQNYVFDIYLNRSKKEMKRLANQMPMYMKVKVE